MGLVVFHTPKNDAVLEMDINSLIYIYYLIYLHIYRAYYCAFLRCDVAAWARSK